MGKYILSQKSEEDLKAIWRNIAPGNERRFHRPWRTRHGELVELTRRIHRCWWAILSPTQVNDKPGNNLDVILGLVPRICQIIIKSTNCRR